jgi:hypothetical protein
MGGIQHSADEVSAMEQRTNTISFACKLLGSRVRVRLDHLIETSDTDSHPGHIRVSARMTSCSGNAACGWRHARFEACPFRCAAGI